MVKAIETEYKGYRFRSRLEARWAIFFDVLGVRWEYEPEGYVLPDGRTYLPDFKLILGDDDYMFAEVKHSEIDDFEGEHVDRCRALAVGSGVPVLLLTGAPACRLYHVFLPQPGEGFWFALFRDYDPRVCVLGGPGLEFDYWVPLTQFDTRTGRHVFPFDERRMEKAFGRGLVDAINAARSARFEHGESPDRLHKRTPRSWRSVATPAIRPSPRVWPVDELDLWAAAHWGTPEQFDRVRRLYEKQQAAKNGQAQQYPTTQPHP